MEGGRVSPQGGSSGDCLSTRTGIGAEDVNSEATFAKGCVNVEATFAATFAERCLECKTEGNVQVLVNSPVVNHAGDDT